MKVREKVFSLFRKGFIGGYWSVGYRDRICEDKQSYRKVEIPAGQWAADPFLYEVDGEHYLFAEQYDVKKSRAGIGYFHFENGIPINKGMIIEQPYHMSYPCVFTYQNHHYMIPETSANDTIELYEAEHFPDQWKLVKTLLNDAKYWDSTVYQDKNDYMMLSYRKEKGHWVLVQFKLDMENKELSKKQEILYSRNIARPAGMLFRDAGKLLRPAQNSEEAYGKSLLLYEVLDPSAGNYTEQYACSIESEDIKFPARYSRIHTLNKDSQYEVVDVFTEVFKPLKTFSILKRAYFTKSTK